MIQTPILDPVLKFKRNPVMLKSKTMNAQETLEAIEIMKAWANGEDVEFQATNTPGRWDLLGKPDDDGNPCWRFDVCRYRRKPKPQEFWIVMQKHLLTGGSAFTSQIAAIRYAAAFSDTQIIHVKQVL